NGAVKMEVGLNGTQSSSSALYEFLFPGPDCEQMCVIAITTALVIVIIGIITFLAVFIFIVVSMPSKKAEGEMKKVREEMRKEWDERKALKAEAKQIEMQAKIRKANIDEHSGNGTDRSSSFFHVGFKEPVRKGDKAVAFEMQPLNGSQEHLDDHSRRQSAEEEVCANPLLRRPDENYVTEVVVEHVPVDDEDLRRRSASYDEVYETPRQSVASFDNFPRNTDYLSDDEYLDARSTVYVSTVGLNEDADRTLTELAK
ncbi:hypothetical protein PFISCL1PPCAC_9837, partial [Pristionchus fissidentatus]